MDLDVSSYGDKVVSKLDQFELIDVADDKNTRYPVIAVAPKQTTFEAGQTYTLQIRVDGSPSGSIIWGTRKLTLTLDKAIFGNSSDLTFTLRTDEIKKKKVEHLQ